MVGLICCIAGIAVFLTVFLWVSGIDYMKENYPDYKGEDFLEDPEKNIEKD
jgi:hypothetical protein